MNIPITKRVMMGGSKKGCGCSGECQCNKSIAKKALVGDQNQLPAQLQDAIKAAPGKMWGAAKVAHGKKSPAKKGSCGGKRY